MIFNDFTLDGGRIRSQHTHDTREIAPKTLDLFTGLLKNLQEGEQFEVGHGVAGLPSFSIMLGLAGFDTDHYRAPGFFFSLVISGMKNAPDAPAGADVPPPFQINLVLPTAFESEAAYRSAWLASATITNFSYAFGGMPGNVPKEYIVDTVSMLWDNRPCVASVPILLPGITPQHIVVGSDAATNFAAALLLRMEHRAHREEESEG